MISTKLSLITPQWNGPENVLAYSTTRIGGVSEGVYGNLNFGNHVGDDSALVKANRELLPQHQSVQWLDQVHGNTVVDISTGLKPLPQADAAYSNSPNLYCAVMTADCVPILITNTYGNEVCAIHAGWRGLANDVISNAIKRFTTSAKDLLAWIGPSISKPCYEVDKSTTSQFIEFDECAEERENGRYSLDLSKIAESQLAMLGVRNIVQSGLCTYSDEEKFFSHRRTVHQGLATCGRQVTVIGFTELN